MDNVWFGNNYARNYTRTLTAKQKDVWYDLIKQRGLIRHEYYDRVTLAQTCQECFRQAIK